MDLDAFPVVIVLGGGCGFVMVVGAMYFLYKGIITLNGASGGPAVDVEFKNLVKITTTYPSLGLFVIGLAFVISAAWIAKSNQPSLMLSGRVNVSDPGSVTIRVSAFPQTMTPTSDGTIEAPVHMDTFPLWVELIAPGYEHPTQTKAILREQVTHGEVALGEVEFGKQVAAKPTGTTDIQAVSGLPPVSEAGAFGGGARGNP